MQLADNNNLTAQFLTTLFIRLNEEKLTYCVLRNYESLPEKIGNDVDIWVKNGDQSKFQNILFDSVRIMGWELVEYMPKYSFQGEGNYLLSKENQSVNIINIDCITYLYWRGLNFIDEEIIPNHLLFYEKGFYILSPGIEAGILLLKNLIYHGNVQNRYEKQIVEYSKKDSEGFLKAIKSPFGEKVANIIFNMAKTGEWDKLEGKYIFLRWTLFKKAVIKKPFLQCKYWVIYFYGQLKKYLFPANGLFLVLIGPDGSGKSTTANNLLNSEVRKLFLKKLYFHGHFPFLPELKKIVGFFRKGKNTKDSFSSSDNSISEQEPFGILRSIVYPIYYGLNYFLGHGLIWRERARGGLVVFDRYFYDYLIQMPYKNCPRWIIYLIARIIPKPDILVYLKNNPETIHYRKPELSIEEIKRQLEICEDITKYYKNGAVVDTSSSPEEVVEKIQRIMINKIKGKQRIAFP